MTARESRKAQCHLWSWNKMAATLSARPAELLCALTIGPLTLHTEPTHRQSIPRKTQTGRWNSDLCLCFSHEKNQTQEVEVNLKTPQIETCQASLERFWPRWLSRHHSAKSAPDPSDQGSDLQSACRVCAMLSGVKVILMNHLVVTHSFW